VSTTLPTPPPHALAALADRWRDAAPSERANAQLYLVELCDALGGEKPRPAGTGYEFEYTVRIVHRDGSEAVNRIDLFREGCFLLEAKDEGERRAGGGAGAGDGGERRAGAGAGAQTPPAATRYGIAQCPAIGVAKWPHGPHSRLLRLQHLPHQASPAG
jgi:hypothetical protein